MSEARQIESEAATYLDQISRYFLTRGKIVSKVAKYPHVVSWSCYFISSFTGFSTQWKMWPGY